MTDAPRTPLGAPRPTEEPVYARLVADWATGLAGPVAAPDPAAAGAPGGGVTTPALLQEDTPA